ncbi:ribosome biogenesis ATPase [Fistulifera solaris]|uniref:Ribosome biogenesis ATPase n=1 Tax=Fistulifera solaris TaxID=1519565 RepID=A0A1Z5JI63_FISSO|nr:ribosome biogenesis ATPase [Fistulifera solaris]|eukprot:GAX13461.1 ribosome biogenesis ATPase [Fistulifera solaris]
MGKKIVLENDPKLSHLVRKIIQGSDEEATDAEAVVTELRYKYREYQRKDVPMLVAKVSVLLEQIADESNARNKRKSIEEEDKYEQEARENDAMREQHGLGGGLNASLRNRYRQLSKENHTETEMAKKSSEDLSCEMPVESVESSSEKKSPKIKRRKIIRKSSVAGPPSGDGSDDTAFLTPVPRPTERYSDLGGMDEIIREIRQLVEYPLVRPELYRHLGIEPPRGVLLRGPPGTGKSALANAGTYGYVLLCSYTAKTHCMDSHLLSSVAGQLNVTFFRVSAPELVTGMSGESEGRIRNLFKTASSLAPSIIFMDELDAIAPKRSEGGSSRGMEKRMVAQLLTCMDMLSPENNRDNAAVIVLAATNRPDAMDPALRRAGRFDKEILMGIPDEEAREKIIATMTKDMRLSGDFDYKVLARKTPGFVGADIRSLTKEAAVIAINRIFSNVLKGHDLLSIDEAVPASITYTESGLSPVTPLTPAQMDPLFVTMEDFLTAIPLVQPSSKREGFAMVPDVDWEDVGALESIREELAISVLEPIRNPEKFTRLGLSLPAGILLYGPPGCGKTLLAKAIAHESGANFISVKGPELLDKYVGESERAVRTVFERARCSSPCVVFFDELDSLVPKRGSDGGGGGGVSERVVNQLLTEMDGLDGRRSVFIIAATNRPELIDPAMLRPGRLDKLLYVPLPTPEDRVSILKALSSNIALADDVDFEVIGMSTRANGYSGADCAALLREAGLAVLKEDTALNDSLQENRSLQISARHFDIAFSSVMPSVTRREEARYQRIRDRMSNARSRGSVPDGDELPETSGESENNL